MSKHRIIGLSLVGLAGAIGAVSLLGPLGIGALEYRTSETTVNQLIGADLAGLALTAPVALVAAALTLRRHPAGPVLALAPAVWAVYVYAQVVVGQEFLTQPGNVERFFPLLLTAFVLGEAVAVLAWSSIDTTRLPMVPRRLGRATATVLFLIAAFLVIGLHLPSLVDALGDMPTAVEYTSSPTAFWVVKLMDLGIVVPAALAIAVGLRRGRGWAQKASYALLGGYTLLGAAVAGMAWVMYLNGDPDGSVANVVVFSSFTVALGWLTVRLYRPLFDPSANAIGPEAGHDRVATGVRGPGR